MFSETALAAFALVIAALCIVFAARRHVIKSRKKGQADIRSEPHCVLAASLMDLRVEIAEQVKRFDEVQVRSAVSFEVAEGEIQYTRLIDRKERFVGYRDALVDASARINLIVRALRDDESLIGQLLDRIKSRTSAPAIGQTELQVIEKVISDLDREASNDLLGEIKMKKSKAEIQHARSFREAMAAVEKRLRDQEIPNPKEAKAARSLDEK